MRDSTDPSITSWILSLPLVDWYDNAFLEERGNGLEVSYGVKDIAEPLTARGTCMK